MAEEREKYKEIQDSQSIEERIAPYAEKIKQIKDKIAEEGEDAVKFADFFGCRKAPALIETDIRIYAEYAAVMAVLEEYELLELLLRKSAFFGEEELNSWLRGAFAVDEAFYENINEDVSEKYNLFNNCVRPQFSYWEPTPLYFIVTKKVIEKMKDPCKMLRFLVSKGANVNRGAGDGSTPLWNSSNIGIPLEVLQTLLELGADPNKKSINDELTWTPLVNCLCPTGYEQSESGEEHWQPFDDIAAKKAKLLLEHKADPNLEAPCFPGYPPLVMAVIYGFPQNRKADEPLSLLTLELVELLLQKGAKPNFIDAAGITPLALAADNNLPEVEELLLKYGAKKRDENSKLAKLIKLFRKKGALLIRPASDEAIADCSKSLKEEWNLPELPPGYADFLKITNGYCFDGVELFRIDDLNSFRLESAQEVMEMELGANEFHIYYGEALELGYPLLCFGWLNGDALTYDPQRKTYQYRDHETAFREVIEEYDSFEKFFAEVVGKWSNVDLIRQNHCPVCGAEITADDVKRHKDPSRRCAKCEQELRDKLPPRYDDGAS
jgi:ankyrin repeat protein